MWSATDPRTGTQIISNHAEEELAKLDAVDLDTVRDDLASAVQTALEPAHLRVWTSQRGLRASAATGAGRRVRDRLCPSAAG